MHFAHLVEGPLLWVALCVFFAAMIIRAALFALSLFLGERPHDISRRTRAAVFGRFSALGREFAVKKFPYALSLFLLHVCLLAIPIWLYGHVILWEESVFELSWPALPDIWADRLTLLLLGLAACFLARRIFFRSVRVGSTFSDYLLITLTTLPFLTGYFLTHGTLESIPFLDNYMMTLHVLAGEVMLIAVAFLFCRVRLARDKCIGCAACSLLCPAGALQAEDAEGIRTLSYVHRRCVVCGICVRACPEGAAELKHELGMRRIFQPFSKDALGNVELSACKECGALYLPAPQLDKVSAMLADESVYSCPTCKTAAAAKRLYVRDLRQRDLAPTAGSEYCVHGAKSRPEPETIQMPT
jgi:ferredoxin